jgi:hypothetical protein
MVRPQPDAPWTPLASTPPFASHFGGSPRSQIAAPRKPSEDEPYPNGSLQPSRLFSGILGGAVYLATFVASAAADPEGVVLVVVAMVGVGAALAGHWLLWGRRGHRPLWYHTIPLSVAGAVVGLVVLGVTVAAGDPEAMGFVLGAGISYGLLLGLANALLIFSFRGRVSG